MRGSIRRLPASSFYFCILLVRFHRMFTETKQKEGPVNPWLIAPFMQRPVGHLYSHTDFVTGLFLFIRLWLCVHVCQKHVAQCCVSAHGVFLADVPLQVQCTYWLHYTNTPLSPSSFSLPFLFVSLCVLCDKKKKPRGREDGWGVGTAKWVREKWEGRQSKQHDNACKIYRHKTKNSLAWMKNMSGWRIVVKSDTS